VREIPGKNVPKIRWSTEPKPPVDDGIGNTTGEGIPADWASRCNGNTPRENTSHIYAAKTRPFSNSSEEKMNRFDIARKRRKEGK
jgi:hypothetical protein